MRGVVHDGRTEDVKAERQSAAFRAEEPPRDPPQAATQPDGEEAEGKPQQVLYEAEFVARLPSGAVQRASGVQPVLRFAEVVDREQDEPLGGEREAGEPVGEGAVAVQVAAGGEVALQDGGRLPHLAAAAGIAVVVGVQRLVVDGPQALSQKHQQQRRGHPLWTANVEALESHRHFRV